MSGAYITNLMMSLCGTMGLSIMASLAVLLGSVLSYHTKKYEDEKRESEGRTADDSENTGNVEETDQVQEPAIVGETDHVQETAIEYISKRMCAYYFIGFNVAMVGFYLKSQISKELSEGNVDVDLSELSTPTLDQVISAIKEIDTMNVLRVYLLYTLGTGTITQPLQFLAWKLGYSVEGNNGSSLGYVLAILIYSVYLIYKNWIARNVIAIAVTCDAIKYLHLPNLSTAYLLLWSFLCLDYFWVFIVNAMSTAAAVELPIKVVFPGGFGKNNEMMFSLLGCGDILLPGLFMALLHRIDHRHCTGSGGYFKCSFISYAVGLIACSATAHIYHTLLPALIFLVPACTLPPLMLAAIRGELHIFRYDENPTNSTNDSQ